MCTEEIIPLWKCFWEGAVFVNIYFRLHTEKTSSNAICCSPSNPEGLLSVWVGQVMPEVTKKKLVQMFSK